MWTLVINPREVITSAFDWLLLPPRDGVAEISIPPLAAKEPNVPLKKAKKFALPGRCAVLSTRLTMARWARLLFPCQIASWNHIFAGFVMVIIKESTNLPLGR